MRELKVRLLPLAADGSGTGIQIDTQLFHFQIYLKLPEMGRFLLLWMEIQNSEGRMKYVQCMCTEENKFPFPVGKRYSMCVRTSINIPALPLQVHFMEVIRCIFFLYHNCYHALLMFEYKQKHMMKLSC